VGKELFSPHSCLKRNGLETFCDSQNLVFFLLFIIFVVLSNCDFIKWRPLRQGATNMAAKLLYHVLNLVLLLTLNVGKWSLNRSSLFILGGELAQ
jgi:uncharacterized membrane protein YphA (DoxX/SURF4 family)